MRFIFSSALFLLARSAYGKDFEDVDVSKAIFETVVLQEISNDFNETDLSPYYVSLHDQYESRLKDAKSHLLTIGGFDANNPSADDSSVLLHCYHPPLQSLDAVATHGSYRVTAETAISLLHDTHTPNNELRSGYLAAAIALTDSAVGFSPLDTKSEQRIRIVVLVVNNRSEIGTKVGRPSPERLKPFSVTGSNSCYSFPPTVEELSAFLKAKDAYLIVLAPEGEVADSYNTVCSSVVEGRCSVATRSQPFDPKGTELLDEIVDLGNFVLDDGEEDEPDLSSSSSSSTTAPSTSSSSTPPASPAPSQSSSSTPPASPTNKPSSSSSSTVKPSGPTSSITSTHTTSTSDATGPQKTVAIFVAALSLVAVTRF